MHMRGGAAGLSGALALGRSRRSVLVLDAGSPRNAAAGHVHNYLGREGTPPLELLEIGRGEVAQYGVRVTVARVETVRPWDLPGIGFVVTTDSGREVLARRLLAASGVTDVLPDVPGLADRWGRDVLHCPYCHGWEIRDRAITVLATNKMAAHQAMLFRQLTEDLVVVLTEGCPRPTEDDLERLAARGVRVVADPPVQVSVENDTLRGLRLASVRSSRVTPSWSRQVSEPGRSSSRPSGSSRSCSKWVVARSSARSYLPRPPAPRRSRAFGSQAT